MDFSEGTVVAGRYRLGPVLGEGGMGLVVLAADLESDEWVAIKFLRAELSALAGDGNARGRFMRELRVVSRLTSKHVARVRTAGELPDGRPFIVMERLEGQDLAAILKDRGKLPVFEVADYGIQACDALFEAHAAGVVHRDLTPANLFVANEASGAKVLKVLDFGMSKLLGSHQADSVITQVTDVLGSPAYMAPEQLLSARDADARSDIYSIGAILYRLATGELPISARSFREHVDHIVAGDVVAPRALVPDMPAGFEAIILRCLDKRPENRFQEVSQLARALSEYCAPTVPASLERIALIERAPPLAEAASLSPAPARAEPESPARRSMSTTRFVALTALLLIVAAVSGALLAARRPH